MNSLAKLGLLVAAAVALGGGPVPSRAAEGTPSPSIRSGDPWTADRLVTPDDLAALLRSTKGGRPLLVHVGFRALYRQGGIPGSIYAGPGSKPEGLAALRRAVRNVPKDRAIVLYCGCCPWLKCPNMRPAYRALHDLGYRNVRALYVAENLTHDWVERGFPIAAPRD